jgi:hypothetical protein
MRMIGHYHRGIQINAFLIALQDDRNHYLTSLSCELDALATAEGYEVSSSWYSEVRQIATPDNQVFGFPRLDWFEPARVRI